MRSLSHWLSILLFCLACIPSRAQTPATHPTTIIETNHRSQANSRLPTQLHEAQPELVDYGVPDDYTEEEKHVNRFWIRAEYLLWWIDDPEFPILVTTGPNTVPRPGALNDAFTELRFGGERTESNERSGVRISAGYWFDDCQRTGFEANYFFLGERSVLFASTSPGSPVIARPFFNAVSQQEDSSLTTFPGLASGTIVVESPLKMEGAEGNWIFSLNDSHDYPVRGLLGFRFVNLEEDLFIRESSIMSPAAARFPGRTIAIADHFGTENLFYGGQLGFSAAYRIRRLELEAVAKVALGAMHQEVTVGGQTTIDTTPATNNNAGLLAVASNSGVFSRNVFTVVPEVNLNAHFHLTERLRATIGFTFLHLGQVARAAGQIDRQINPRQVPTSTSFGVPGGPARPQRIIEDTDFWTYGLNIGFELRF